MAVARLSRRHAELEHQLPGLAAVVPLMIEGAFLWAGLMPSDVEDDTSRLLVCSAIITKAIDPLRMVSLASSELTRMNVHHDRLAMFDRLTKFCPDCIVLRRHCHIAQDTLFALTIELAEIKARLFDAADAMQFAARRLEGRAA
ncbi:MAG: hypothetical protein SGI86_21705 [Deltaproteobacteria bacterium]|nr:hypothetical protein [Deltaproteobacteria bacterium]